MTITIKLDTDDTDETQSKTFDAARATFPNATSITIESEDGTSETIYTRKS